MNYLKSEHLKFKRTISNKLLFIIPFVTAIFAWIIGGFLGFQYMTFYWWYAFLLPGSIAILCALSHRKEENAGKYYSVFSMPMNLSKFEAAKGIVLIEKLLISAIFLALIISISNFISPATAVYSITQSVIGSVCIILASIWQIPLCLFLARKAGLFLPIVLNTVLGIFAPIVMGNTAAWWIVPYCYAAKLAEPLMGIELNGTFVGNSGFSTTVLISIALSMLLFGALTYIDAKNFSKGEITKMGLTYMVRSEWIKVKHTSFYATVIVANEQLAKALLKLSDKRREIIILYFYCGYRDTSIGKLYGCCRSTTNYQRLTALKQLRKEMEVSHHAE